MHIFDKRLLNLCGSHVEVVQVIAGMWASFLTLDLASISDARHGIDHSFAISGDIGIKATNLNAGNHLHNFGL